VTGHGRHPVTRHTHVATFTPATLTPAARAPSGSGACAPENAPVPP
jgi:hypothetical protein